MGFSQSSMAKRRGMLPNGFSLSVLCDLCGKAFAAVYGRLADFVAVLPVIFIECLGSAVAGFVDEYPLYLPLPAAHFLMVFLSALCVLCGKAFAAVSYIHEMKLR